MPADPDPIQRFSELYQAATKTDLQEPSAVTLATATPDGKPSARVVLLKSFDQSGFVFYTNLASQKAADLQANPRAELCFYWEQISYQVRVQGHVRQVSDEEADAYFATRPHGSQIGAYASKQSSPLESMDELFARFKKYEAEFAGRPVPRPPFWSGYRLLPERMEFWKRGQDRLHERTLFIYRDGKWEVSLLYP